MTNQEVAFAVEKHRRRTTEVEAVYVTPYNTRQVADWVNGEPDAYRKGYAGRAYPDIGGVELPDGPTKHVRANWNDFVVRTPDGRFWPWKREAFEAAYEYVGTHGPS